MALTGCDKGDIEPETSKLENKYIDLVTIYKDDSLGTEVLYDKNTKVMYFVNKMEHLSLWYYTYLQFRWNSEVI